VRACGREVLARAVGAGGAQVRGESSMSHTFCVPLSYAARASGVPICSHARCTASNFSGEPPVSGCVSRSLLR